jgi:hypothetical protein
MNEELPIRQFEQHVTDELRRGTLIGGLAVAQHTNPDGSTIIWLAQAILKD